MLTILTHPLAQHILTNLRDRATEPARFRDLCHQLSLLLALEATRNMRVNATEIDTPIERCTGVQLSAGLAVIPILRAGLGMVQPIVDLFPDVSIGYLGFERNHKTAVAESYYCKLPPLAGKRVLVVDPMLATGGTAVQALEVIFAQGGTDVALLSVVSSPEGVARVEARFPSIGIFTASLDRGLDERKYIVPGLGDFGDRLYGT